MTKESIVLILLFAYIFIRSFFIEPNSLEVTKYEIRDEELQGVRVVYFSDLDIKKRDFKRLGKIVTLINDQLPDIVLMGGDYTKERNVKHSMEIDTLASKLSFINAPIYAVLGDEDWSAGAQEFIDAFTKNKIVLLENENSRIRIRGKYVDIIGLSDFTYKEPEIEKAFRKTAPPRIVITHNPDIYYSIMDEVSMIFAGHTHGGQFILPFTPPLFVPSKFGAQFASGLIEATSNKMIITTGVGTAKVPFRLNCKPEIVVVDFVK